MCSRYTITQDIEAISSHFSIEKEEYYRPRYNAAPSQLLPVISQQKPSIITFMHWGVTPEWAHNKSISKKLYNIQSNDIIKKPSFKKALLSNRCLVPADGFYGWKQISKKREIPYRITLDNKGIFAMPALYEEYENENNEIKRTFTIITKAANPNLQQYDETMPIILNIEQSQAWLSEDNTEEVLLELLDDSTTMSFDSYAVTPQVNDITKDVPSLIQPSTPADQFGNYSLFD